MLKKKILSFLWVNNISIELAPTLSLLQWLLSWDDYKEAEQFLYTRFSLRMYWYRYIPQTCTSNIQTMEENRLAEKWWNKLI